MATKEELQDQIDELTVAIGSPERQVTLGSQNITYRTVTDLLAARSALQDQLNDMNAAEGQVVEQVPYRRTAVYRGRGFN